MEGKLKPFLIWTCVGLLCFVGIPIHMRSGEDVQLESQFDNFTQTYNRTYKETLRPSKLERFKHNVHRIKQLNQEEGALLSSILRGDEEPVKSIRHRPHHRKQWEPGTPKHLGGAKYGVTKFADLSPEEFRDKLLDKNMMTRIKIRQSLHVSDPQENLIVERRRRRKRAPPALDFSALPPKVDWRDKNVVTPVKQQKNCGGCWAFSTVETVESMAAIQKGTLQELSVQQVIDCSTNGNMGCYGGNTCNALAWMSRTKVALEKDYPTTLKDQVCKLLQAPLGVTVAMNFTCENLVNNEQKMLNYLAHHGPIVTAVDATNWQYYVGGVIQWNCDANVNHAVQIVGYDATVIPPHYIVRNSWGTDYGDNGYLYVAIGTNLCGVAIEVSKLSVA